MVVEAESLRDGVDCKLVGVGRDEVDDGEIVEVAYRVAVEADEAAVEVEFVLELEGPRDDRKGLRGGDGGFQGIMDPCCCAPESQGARREELIGPAEHVLVAVVEDDLPHALNPGARS